MRRTLLFLALSLLAVPLFAAVRIDPAAPTSATPVTITVSALLSRPDPPLVNRSGLTITVTLQDHPQLGDTLRPQTFAVPVGLLTPGDYEVIVLAPDGVSRRDETMFFVGDAAATLHILGPSIGPTTGGTSVVIDAGTAASCQDFCTPTVTFNGVPAPLAAPPAFAPWKPPYFVVTAPPNPKGVANVVVTGPGGTTSGEVFRYYDPDDPPASSMFERVLFPIVLGGSGAFGSRWVTELTALNASGFTVEAYHASLGDSWSSGPLVFPTAAGTSQGALLFVPRDVSSSIHFGSVVRDLSREADDWGTEVPAVRESDFKTGTFSLLNVPTDPRYRLTLRIYGVDSAKTSVTVTATVGDKVDTASLVLQSANPCEPTVPCNSTDPAYVSVDPRALFPDLDSVDRARFDIDVQGQRAWAFVTITNNATQHVTLITPQ